MAGKRQHSDTEVDERRMSFGDHLEELRLRIILSLAAVIVMFFVCLALSKQVFAIVIRPAFIALKKYGQDPALQALSPPDTFLIYLKIAIICGCILAAPIVLWQIWQFVAAGLYAKEQKFVRRAVWPSILLFVVGVCFMYFIVLPIVFDFFIRFSQSFPLPDWPPTFLERQLIGESETVAQLPEIPNTRIPLRRVPPQPAQPGDVWLDPDSGHLKLVTADGSIVEVATRASKNTTAINNQYSLNFYVSFILHLSLAFGIAFQLPLVVIFLAVSGLVDVSTMSKGRGYVILGIAIGAAVLTPPDVVSQILLGVPMVVLFEGGLVVARLMLRGRSRSPTSL